MKIHIEKTGPCRKVIKIEVPAESVKAEYEKVVQSCVRDAVIPGFRKGHAPDALVERRYAKVIEDKIKDQLVFRSYQEALKEKNIKPVAVLDFSDVTIGKDQPMTYKVTLDVSPEFKLPKYKGLSLEKKKVNEEVSDADVQKRLEEIVDQLAKYVDVENRAVREHDLVQVDYQGTCEGKPISNLDKTVSVLAQGKDFWVNTDDNAFIPGLNAGLQDMKIGEQKEIHVDFPADFTIKTMAGKQAVYIVKVKAVRGKQSPEIDAEFLKKVSVDSEEALREKIRSLLMKEADVREKSRLKKEIIDMLLSKTSLDLPESLVQEETRNMFTSMVRQNLQRGMTREQVDGKKEEILNFATKSAGDKVKLGYILHRIADEENITAEDKEVTNSINELAEYHHVDPEVLRKDLNEKNELGSIRSEICMNKTLDFILENVNIGEQNFLHRLRVGSGKK